MNLTVEQIKRIAMSYMTHANDPETAGHYSSGMWDGIRLTMTGADFDRFKWEVEQMILADCAEIFAATNPHLATV